MLSRRIVTVGALTVTCFACATPASAEEPVVAPSCTAAVEGVPGQQVVLDPRSLADPIAAVLAGVDPLGLVAGPFREAWRAVPPIPVGAVPSGDVVISGAAIADAVVVRLGELPVLALVLKPLTPAVRQSLATVCGIVARGAVPDPPGQGAPPPPAPGQQPPRPPGQAGQPGQAGSVGTPPVPYRPSASERYYQASTNRTPTTGAALGNLASFGRATPGAATVPTPRAEPARGPERSAGDARVVPSARDELPVAILLAVVLLAVVGALLVRRWVLRAHR